MVKFTVEETNLLSIYDDGGDRHSLAKNIFAAMPYMDEAMKDLALRALFKAEALTDEEYTEYIFCPAEEV